MSERARDIEPYEPSDEEYAALMKSVEALDIQMRTLPPHFFATRPDPATHAYVNRIHIGAAQARLDAMTSDERKALLTSLVRNEVPTEDEPESWSRSPRGPVPESWRKRGRPFDPRQRAPSRGEQRRNSTNVLLYAFGGVLVACSALWGMWSVIVG